MLEVRNLKARGVEIGAFTVASGECVAVGGPSGAGKTVLLRALADLDPCDGEVSLDGRSWRAMSAPEWRRQVVFVPAEPGWWSETTIDHFEWPKRLREPMHRLGLDAALLRRPVAQLSTGERQRLALLRALERSPLVLLLDEPTSALDDERCLAVEALLAERMATGVSVVLVSHDREQTARLAGRRFVLKAGRLVDGSPA